MKYRIAHEIRDWRPADLNNHDHILFYKASYDPESEGLNHRSAIWDGKDILLIPGNFRAIRLNDLGQVVGTCEGEAAFYADGVVTKLGPGTINGINIDGSMVGSIKIDGQSFPCFWRNGIIDWQGSEPGDAIAINSRNDYVFFTCKPQSEDDIENGVQEVIGAFACENGSIRRLTGPNREVENVKPTDIDNNGVIIGYFAGDSVQKKQYEDDDEESRNMAHELGYVPLRWRGDAVEVIKKGSLGYYPSRIGPNDFVIGTMADGTNGDIPTCLYADFVSVEWIHDPEETGWNSYNEMVFFDAAVAINDHGNILMRNSQQGCTLLVPNLEESTSISNPKKTWDDTTLSFHCGTKAGWKLIANLSFLGLILVVNIWRFSKLSSSGKGITLDVLGVILIGLIMVGGAFALNQMWGSRIEVKDTEIELISREGKILRSGNLWSVDSLWASRSFIFYTLETYTIRFTSGQRMTFSAKFKGRKELVRLIEERSGMKFRNG